MLANKRNGVSGLLTVAQNIKSLYRSTSRIQTAALQRRHIKTVFTNTEKIRFLLPVRIFQRLVGGFKIEISDSESASKVAEDRRKHCTV